MKDRFIAEKDNFQGENGYTVAQIHDGREVVKQFIPESSYEFFCKAIGVIPEIKE